MIRICLLISIFFATLSLGPFAGNQSANAQNGEQEVFLQFRYQNVVNTYVSAVYESGDFYLSPRELFDALQIDLETDRGGMVLQGNYLGRGPYTIDLNNRRATFEDREIEFTADDYMISDLGFYLHPDLYYHLFELEFFVDFNNLSILLETGDTMPVVAQRDRERRRERLIRTQRELTRSYDQLIFDRNPSVFDGGFLDYNLTANVNTGPSGNTTNYLYSTNIGTEVLGGDFQGSIFGSYSQTATVLRSNGLRWRYGIRDNEWISTIVAGQTTTEGLAPAAITGVSVTNEPIEPRYLYGETAFTGTTEPNSEVELYRNNTLVDFAEADVSGEYRFVVPITYGTSQYTVRIYSPTGEMTQRDARLQIPFNFLPPGEVSYNINAGRLDNPIAGSTERGLASKGNLSAGITNWLTASGGVEYFEDFHEELPTFTGTLSSRFFTNYLISLQAANDAFYRASGSVIYPSNASLNVDYTRFNTQGGIYNSSRNLSLLRANLFTPFEIGSLPLFLRWSFTNEQRENSSIFRYRIDFNTRLGRTNFRISYRDTQTGRFEFQTTPTARVHISGTYNFGRTRQIPRFLRGVFLRSQMNVIPAISEIEDVEIQVSQNIFDRGRFQISAGRNLLGDFNLLRFSLAFDFNRFRSNSSFRSSRNSSILTQSIRGSAGFDSNHNRVLLSNRQQAGQAGIAVRTFVDSNNNGLFDKEEDELIPENAVRIDRAGGNTFSKKGINYISQLQPYRRYNMSVNKSVINNPLLVPDLDRFSLVTDPNQYKLIEIPFYMSGIVDGRVNRVRYGKKEGIGGIRLYLNQVNIAEGAERFSEELRTFSDGSFYSYEIPPGDYEIEVDPSQLEFLGVETEKEKLTFTLRALAEGDFVEGLEINLVPEGEQRDEEQKFTPFSAVFDHYGIDRAALNPRECLYGFQIGTYTDFSESVEYTDQTGKQTGIPFDLHYESNDRNYIVRTATLFSISELEVALVNIKPFVDPENFVLISECSDEIETLLQTTVSNRYSIQLGSFDNEPNAREFAEKLDTHENIDTVIEYDPGAGIYRVTTPPLTGQAALYETSRQIASVPEIQNSYIQTSQGRDEDRNALPFRLRLATFPAVHPAAAYAKSINQAFNVGAYIQRNGPDIYEVLTEREFNRDELYEMIKSIASVTEFEKPIVLKSGMERSAPGIIPVPEDDRTIPDGMTLNEYLTESGLEIGADFSECRFPVQIGSFADILNATHLAIYFQDKFKTDISLYFNENTNLYGLRTESYSSVFEALQQIESFKEIDSSNQLALVVQCNLTDENQPPIRSKFVVPLVQYFNENQAKLRAREIENRFGVKTTARDIHSGQYFTIYAGPFDNYNEAQIAGEVLQNFQTDRELSIILDPQTKNRLNFKFQLHLGAFARADEAIKIANFIKEQSERMPEASSDFLGYLHLKDSETFLSWSNFIDFVQNVNVYRELNINYLIFE